MDRERLVIGIVITLFLALASACTADYANSTPETREARISDKTHRPGYYSVTCSGGKHRSCHPVWHPPVWTVWYNDEEGRHSEGVSEGIYDMLAVGQRVSVAFFKGAYFGIRYGTVFTPARNGW
jgi:hypothetical protein